MGNKKHEEPTELERKVALWKLMAIVTGSHPDEYNLIDDLPDPMKEVFADSIVDCMTPVGNMLCIVALTESGCDVTFERRESKESPHVCTVREARGAYKGRSFSRSSGKIDTAAFLACSDMAIHLLSKGGGE